MSNVERELKIVLETRADYESLCRLLPGFLDEREQENSYWDSAEFRLARAHILLRLRREASAARITVKRGPPSREDGVFTVPEFEEEVDFETASRVLAAEAPLESLGSLLVQELTTEWGLDRLLEWGTLRNIRRRYQLEEGWIAEVDRTEYPESRVEFEVEIEIPDPKQAIATMEEYFRRGGIQAHPQTRTKSERLAEICGIPVTPG